MDLAFDRRGTGEPLVLLHGLSHRRQGWDPVLDRLAAERDVIAVDLPGHGDSPPFPAGQPLVYADVVAELEKFLGHLGLDRPHVAGNSLGGLLSIELAARGRARTATALSPAGYWNKAERTWTAGVFQVASSVGRRMPAGPAAALARHRVSRVSLFGLFFGRPGRHDPAVLTEELRRMGELRPLIRTVLRRLDEFEAPPVPPPDVPVTIAWGRRDLILVPWQARRAKRAIPHARIVPLPGCGHVPMGDDPDRVAAVILDATRPPV
ncbi:MAG TPA: alpha/beta hydrolase [Acidimicrobiia bacterium]|nr:alpha/beta hydrolase [Acidimicrobiia bacterium]